MDGDTDKFTFDADKKLTDFKVTDDANWKKLVTAAKALKA